MKRMILLFLVFVFCGTVHAQINFDNPPWETGCDSLTSTLEMNLCSAQKFEIADSMLTNYYQRLEKRLDEQIAASRKMARGGEKLEKQYLEDLKAQKKAVLKAKEEFGIFRDHMLEVIHYQYKGGTLRPLFMNVYGLELTVNQLKIVEQMLDDIGK